MTGQEPPACGTVEAFRWHRRNGDQPCPDCYAAQAAYQRAWRLRRYGSHGQIAAADETAAVYSRPCREAGRAPATPVQIRELVEAVTGAGPADAVNVVYLRGEREAA
jgi:hypothetical protein